MTYTKSDQLYQKRAKPKRRNITKITQKVREEVLERSGWCCERCGRHSKFGMEMAHLLQASHGGRGDTASNVVLLCGPSTQTGTCHNHADYTRAGRKWREQKRKELQTYYGG